MLINDLLYMLTVGWIMDKTVFINKHHRRLVCITSDVEFVNGFDVVDFPFFTPLLTRYPVKPSRV